MMSPPHPAPPSAAATSCNFSGLSRAGLSNLLHEAHVTTTPQRTWRLPNQPSATGVCVGTVPKVHGPKITTVADDDESTSPFSSGQAKAVKAWPESAAQRPQLDRALHVCSQDIPLQFAKKMYLGPKGPAHKCGMLCTNAAPSNGPGAGGFCTWWNSSKEPSLTSIRTCAQVGAKGRCAGRTPLWGRADSAIVPE